MEKTLVPIMLVLKRRCGFKDDNVLHRGLRWEGYGSVIEVPEDDAPYYIKHPTVWTRADSDVAAAVLEEIKSGEVTVPIADNLRELRPDQPAPGPPAPLPTEPEPKPEPPTQPIVTEPMEAESDTAKEAEALRRQQMIINAIGGLSPSNSDQFLDGKPREEAISAAVGFDVSWQERDIAWAAINEAAATAAAETQEDAKE